MRSSQRALMVGTILGVTGAAPTAGAEEVKVGDVTHSAPSTGKLRAVRLDGKDAIEVSGAGTPVRVDWTPALAKAPPNKTLSLVKVGIRHVDRGTHGFDVALIAGRARAGAQIQCDNFRPASARIQCDNFKPGVASGSATITPRFDGSATFSVSVVKNGATVRSLSGQTGGVTIADFDTVHDGGLETLGVTIGYGLERKGAWSIRIEHDAYVVTVTAEAQQAPPSGGAALTLGTTGLDSVTLVGHKIELQDAPSNATPNERSR